MKSKPASVHQAMSSFRRSEVPLTKGQKLLKKKHGDFEEFAQATWRTCDSGEVTVPEALKAIDAYKAQWRDA